MTVHTKRPAKMDVRLDNIPECLKQIPRWLVWKWKKKTRPDGSIKWDKPPLCIDGTDGSSTNPSKWATYEQAVLALPDFDGIGLAMGEDGIGLIGIDLDDCRDPQTGFLTEEAEEIIESLDTYAEISPSGTGVKLWLLGKYDKTKWRSKVGNKEVYVTGRYFTVTGHTVRNKPIADIDLSFYDFLAKYMKKSEESAKTSEAVEASDDDARIKHAILACLKVEIDEGEGDGSRRLVKYCRQCVRAGLTPEGTIKTVRALEKIHPFPKNWTDAQIVKRYTDATNQSEVGEAVKKYKQCDYDVAKRVRDLAKGSIVYVPRWARWLAWDGRAFTPDDSNRIAETIVQVSEIMLKDDAPPTTGNPKDDEKAQAAHVAFCMKYQSAKGISDAEKLARGFLAVDFQKLDRKSELYHCENGVVALSDIRTMRPHERENLNTVVSDVPFILGAECPRWLKFIDEITAGDKELSRYLQMIVGYCLTGIPASEIFILHGGGGNGKGVFTRTLLKLLGNYGGTISQDLLMNSSGHPTQFAYLYGKRCVVAQETDAECRLNENQVKMLTGGGDKIQCRRMREDFWEFEPTHKILLATNHIPQIRGTDNGIWRRIKLIPFTVTFTNPDTSLDSTLTAELPGILQWALAGYEDFRKNGGFVEPQAVTASRDNYRAEMSTIQQFVEDRCVLAADKSVKTSELYQSYKLYTELHGHYLCSARKFGCDLKSIFGVKDGRTVDSRIKIGIALKEMFEEVK